MKKYKRLTFRADGGIGLDCKACKYDRKTCMRRGEREKCRLATRERLAELEDEIERGTLVPKYSVVKDCGFCCVCEVDTNSLIVIEQYETEEDARKALKAIKERRYADD